MKIEELTAEEKVEMFQRMQEKYREETSELRQIIEDQRQMISSLFRAIEDREKVYRMLYKRYLELKDSKANDEG